MDFALWKDIDILISVFNTTFVCNYRKNLSVNFIKTICQYAIRSAITLVLAVTLFVTNLFWPAASQAIAQALPAQINQPQSNQSWLTGILQLALLNIPSQLKYTKDHEWVLVEGNIAKIGITEYAERQFGETVFAELPKVGQVFDQGDELGTIESVKAVAQFYTPVKGEVVEVNQAVADEPELLNEDPYGDGWLVKIRFSDSSELNALLSSQQYSDYIKESSEA
ncbi:MAG: glycine cleavage system protein GcvH [Nostoc sp. GBBB01]|jgi:glycine cleavage system H protein|uniref:Glycine cleavage system H protein n=1 Tax=Nostoc punctiforme FACHB-252 TaxID=1357509 RepID=A0ABR8H3V7_NOSPU|nr:glycine cleavage system protein GcvH [Nostoc punctiforme FACHB-252]MBL1200382.1 glycine cleavage system protein GcvH [Nostoc sp. GBBB01]